MCLIFSFYIILRGTVSILVDQFESFSTYTRQSTQNPKEGIAIDRLLQVDKMGDELDSTVSEMRRSYGTELRILTPGEHFGEVALLLTNSLSPNTAMSNELCQLLTIGKETFQRHLAAHLQSVLLQNAYFVANHRLFDGWALAFVRQLSASLCKRKLKFQDILFQETKDSRFVYFIKSGTLKLSACSNQKLPRDLINRTRAFPDLTSNGTGQIVSTRGQRRRRLSLRTTTSQSHLSSSSLSSVPSASKLHTTKAPPARRCYRLSEPPPTSGVHICLLGPGDVLGELEAICQLKRSLYTAVSMGRATVYELDVHHFQYLVAQRHPHTLHTMVGELLRRTEEWEVRLPTLRWLGHVTRVLRHVLLGLEDNKGTRKGGGGCRGGKYPPDAVAMAAVKVSSSAVSREGLGSQDSLEDVAQGLPRAKRRLHPFDGPPPPLCDTHAAVNWEPIFPCSYASNQSVAKHKGYKPSGVKTFSPNRMTVLNFEDGNSVEIETGVGTTVCQDGTNPGLNLTFTPQSTLEVGDRMLEEGMKDMSEGSQVGSAKGCGVNPFGPPRHAWGSLGAGGAHSGLPVKVAGENISEVTAELMSPALKSDGPMDMQSGSHLEQPTNSLELRTNSPPSPSHLFPTIRPVDKWTNPPQEPVQPSPQRLAVSPLETSDNFSMQSKFPCSREQPMEIVQGPLVTSPCPLGTPEVSQCPLFDIPKCSSNSVQVRALIETVPRRSMVTPPQRSESSPADTHVHWRLPSIPPSVRMLPLPGTSHLSDTHQGSRPSDTHQGSRPSDTHQGSRPSDTHQGSRPSDTHQGSRPSDTHQGSRPSDTHQGSRPSDTHQGSRPSDTHQGSRPSDTHQGSRPSDTHQGSRPSDTHQGSRPSDTHQGSRPSDTHQGSRPSDTHQGSHPSDTRQGSLSTICYAMDSIQSQKLTQPAGTCEQQPSELPTFQQPPEPPPTSGSPLGVGTTHGPPSSTDPPVPLGEYLCNSPAPAMVPRPLPLAAGRSSPSLNGDDANTDTTISAMWEVPIDVFMREGGVRRTDCHSPRAATDGNYRLHARGKGNVGTRGVPSGSRAYLRSRAQSYPLHHLFSHMVSPLQQRVQPHASIINLAFDKVCLPGEQVQGRVCLSMASAAHPTPACRPSARFVGKKKGREGKVWL